MNNLYINNSDKTKLRYHFFSKWIIIIFILTIVFIILYYYIYKYQKNNYIFDEATIILPNDIPKPIFLNR